MSVTATETTTIRDEILGRIRELRPLFEANAARTEADRRVVEENITALHDAGRVPHHGAEALRRARDRHPHQARGEPRGGDGLRLDGMGDGADERVLVLRLARQRTAAGRRVGRRPRRPDLRRVQPDRHDQAGRRWIRRQRCVELDERLPALGLGVPRRPARRRSRRVRAAGDGADAVLRARDRGHVVHHRACAGRRATPCMPATCSCPTTG